MPAGDGAATGFALSQIAAGQAMRGAGQQNATALWVQDRRVLKDAGRPYPHGLPELGRTGLLHLVARDAGEALCAMEEGLHCPSLAAVIGELHGDPRALDFTATRRLAVAAERYGVPVFLLRCGGHADLSGARRRWRVASRPSPAHPHDPEAPGAPTWSLELFRARDMRPGTWEASYDRAAHRLDLVSPAGDGTLAPAAGGAEPAPAFARRYG
ncbi:ImuA family protein [Altererythrobacter sp. CAU 1778]